MTLHFAEVALALLAGGAAILIVAGLVLEALHRNRRPARNPRPRELATPFAVPVDSGDAAVSGPPECRSKQADNSKELSGSPRRKKRGGRTRKLRGEGSKSARRERKHGAEKGRPQKRHDEEQSVGAPLAETSDV